MTDAFVSNPVHYCDNSGIVKNHTRRHGGWGGGGALPLTLMLALLPHAAFPKRQQNSFAIVRSIRIRCRFFRTIC